MLAACLLFHLTHQPHGLPLHADFCIDVKLQGLHTTRFGCLHTLITSATSIKSYMHGG